MERDLVAGLHTILCRGKQGMVQQLLTGRVRRVGAEAAECAT
jgi:hypothetical protein